MKKLSIVLSMILVLTLFVGCRKELSALDEKLDRLEDQAEQYMDGKEAQIKQYFSPSSSPDSIIPKESAEDIALNHASLTREQVSRLRTEYEIDDGVPRYTVEFHSDGWEYEYEIHGETGKILSYDKDFD